MSGVANMRSGIDSLSRLKRAVSDLPLTLGAAVAKDAAAVLTADLRSSFDGGKTAYDTPRPLSTDGKKLYLRVTGATRNTLAFVSVGSILRAQLGTRYARYLIGKYAVLPTSLPSGWRARLDAIVQEHVAAFESEAMS